tara:strand:- start:42 stop:386 length:345 start_codon:yes stop_codon:yes gene_type:complete
MINLTPSWMGEPKINYDEYLIKDTYYSEGYKKNSVNVYLIPHDIAVDAPSLNIFRHIWRGDGWVMIGHKEKPPIDKKAKERYLKWKREVYPTLEKNYYKDKLEEIEDEEQRRNT